MIAELYREISQNRDVRKNLIEMRQLLKQQGEAEELRKITDGDYHLFCQLLDEDDPKIRKNAVLIMGETGESQLASTIMEHYEKEETLFIRSDYLQALSKLDYEPYLDALVTRCREMGTNMDQEDNQKHYHQEMVALQKLIVAKKGIQKHEFLNLPKMTEVILTTPPSLRELTAKQLKSYRKAATGLGIKVMADDIWPLFEIRTFEEILFPIGCQQPLSAEPAEMGRQIGESDLLSFLKSVHKGEEPFTFRIGMRSDQTLEERSRFTKKVAIGIESITKGMLRNATTGYEVEIRLFQLREGGYYPCLKLFTIKDPRFLYRKETVSSSIKPVTAARIMEIASGYLAEGAQILDPFCGTGTMLVERAIHTPVKNAYGIDTFGEAIMGARNNTARMFPDFHFIHRDFFDFTHDYLFDEIVTNMPVRGKAGKEEIDRLYTRFFDVAGTFLKPGGVMILYSGESGFIHKQLRLHNQFELKEEVLMNRKLDTKVYILRIKE